MLQHEEESEDKGDWGFKAKKQKIKVLYMLGGEGSSTNSKAEEMLNLFKDFLKDIEDGKVSRNYAEKSLNNMLDHLAGMGGTISSKGSNSDTVLKQIYNATLESLSRTGNERMWIKTKMKLAKLYIEQQDLENAQAELTQLQDACTTSNNNTSEDDNTKSTFLMEVYSLLMQLYSTTNNYKKVKELYSKTMSIKSAISHPRILGVIHECGGRIHMKEKRWEAAREDLFESFKNYDEAGSLQRIQVLKYFVLACMLSESGIDPFESQETKPYRQDPKVMVMMQLVEVFQRSDVEEFNRLLKSHNSEIMGDELIRTFLDDLILSIRSQGVLNLVRPYTRVSLEYIAKTIEITVDQAKEILVRLILDFRLPTARIDMVDNYVQLSGSDRSAPAGLAPLIVPAEVPVFFDNRLCGLPVAVAHSGKQVKSLLKDTGMDFWKGKPFITDETSNSGGLQGANNNSTSSTGGGSNADKGKRTTGEDGNAVITNRENSGITTHTGTTLSRRGQNTVSAQVTGTMLASSAPFAAFPSRYAQALEDEASVESGKRVVGAKESNGGSGVVGGGNGGADGGAEGSAEDKKSGDAGGVSGGTLDSHGGDGNGEGIMDFGDGLANRLGGGAGGDDWSQAASLLDWCDNILKMQKVIHANPRVQNMSSLGSL